MANLSKRNNNLNKPVKKLGFYKTGISPISPGSTCTVRAYTSKQTCCGTCCC